MTITLLQIENELSIVSSNLKEAQQIYTELKKLSRKKKQYEAQLIKNQELYTELCISQPESVPEREPAQPAQPAQPDPTPQPDREPTVDIKLTKKDTTPESKSPISVTAIIEDKPKINISNYKDATGEVERKLLKRQLLPDCDETDDLDTEEEDCEPEGENWVNLGTYKRKCYVKERRIYTRVDYNDYREDGRRYKLPKDTYIGHISNITDKFYNFLKVNGAYLPIYNIDEQAWKFMGDMTFKNSILCKYNFQRSEFIDKSKFSKMIKDGIKGLELYETDFVEYPLSTHLLNTNQNYTT